MGPQLTPVLDMWFETFDITSVLTLSSNMGGLSNDTLRTESEFQDNQVDLIENLFFLVLFCSTVNPLCTKCV